VDEWVDLDAESWVPFLAIDLEARNEIGWNVNKTLALGFLLPNRSRSSAWRIGLELYHGRDQQTQFVGAQERYLGVVVAFNPW